MDKPFELVAKTQKMNEQVKDLVYLSMAKVIEDDGSNVVDQLSLDDLRLVKSTMTLLNQTCELMEEQAKILEEIYKNTK